MQRQLRDFFFLVLLYMYIIVLIPEIMMQSLAVINQINYFYFSNRKLPSVTICTDINAVAKQKNILEPFCTAQCKLGMRVIHLNPDVCGAYIPTTAKTILNNVELLAVTLNCNI